MKIAFLVYLPGDKQNCGGHVVMHKFVKLLCEMGEEVWVNIKPFYECSAKILKDLPTSVSSWDEHFVGKTVVSVYPESIEGNPYNTKNVARWILYHADKNIESTWNEDEELFFFNKSFRTSRICDVKLLSPFDAKLDVFYNKGLGSKRNGYCHIVGKNHPANEKVLNSIGSNDISYVIESADFSFEVLAHEFNKYEYFVTYDDATFYSLAAAMCGCRSIILNTDPEVSPQEFRSRNVLFLYGVAYGFHDLKHADLTRDLVRDFLKKTERKNSSQVENFVRFWKNKLST